MKKLTTISFLSILLFVFIFLCSCGENTSYKIYFDVDGTIYESILKTGDEAVNLPSDPTKEGYIFYGWHLSDGNLLSKNFLRNISFSKDLTVYAKWIPEKYKIIFDSKGGSDVNYIKADYDAFITANVTPTKSGCSFSGWYSDEAYNEPYSFTKMPLNGITLYAKWSANSYTITFETNGGSSVAPLIEDFNETIAAPEIPSLFGYTFNGWFSDLEKTIPYTFDKMPSANITVYAKWTLKIRDINTLDITVNYITYGEAIDIIVNTNTGGGAITYEFKVQGEDDNSYVVIIPSNVGLYTLRATSAETDDYQSSTVIVDFTINKASYDMSGVAFEDISYVYDGTVKTFEVTGLPLGLTVNGYTDNSKTDVGDYIAYVTYNYDTASYNEPILTSFNWSIDKAENALLITAHQIIYGQTLEISVDTNPGGGIITYYYKVRGDSDNTYTLNEPTAPGSYTVKAISAATANYNSATAYADFEIQHNQIVVTETNNGTITPDTLDIVYGSDITYTIIPDNGYSIASIAIDGENILITAIKGESQTYLFSDVVENHTITAVFAINQYTATFKDYDGTVLSTSTVDYLTSATAPTDPERTDYIFTGWDTAFNSMTADIIVIATYKIRQYTFETNGGSTVESTTAYNVQESPLTTKEGYTFKGWYDNELFSGEPVTFPYFSKTAIDLYAKWDVGTEGLAYMLINGDTEYEVSYGEATDDDVIIPSVYLGLPVTVIGVEGFNNPSRVKSVIIPEGITSIGDRAFLDCYLMTSLIIPNSVTNIGIEAFSECSGLTSMVIPNGVTRISDYAFFCCTRLASIIIPEGVTSIGDRSFFYSNKLTNIALPDSLVSIDVCAFVGSALTSIIIPGNVTSIGDMAFSGTALTDVTFTEGATSTGTKAFLGCSSLTSVVFPDSFRSIDSNAFSETGLISIIIPEGVTSIGYNAFKTCGNLSIYCAASEKPIGWDTNWNPDGRPVVWLSDGVLRTYAFETNGGSAVDSITAYNVQVSPLTTKEGYTFKGWYDNELLTGEPVTFPYFSKTALTLYAGWTINI